MRNNKNVSKRYLRIAGMVLVLLLPVLMSCSKVTKENYDKLKVGMEYSGVVEVLGEPKECNAILNAKDCTWGDDKRSIKVKIIADKVVFVSADGL